MHVSVFSHEDTLITLKPMMQCIALTFKYSEDYKTYGAWLSTIFVTFFLRGSYIKKVIKVQS